jgi:putative spermidine/putrescine transport system substrate-binding protein
LEQVGTALVANAQAATAKQPGERALHYPAVPTKALARVNASPGYSWGNAARAQRTPQVREVIGLVGVEFGRSSARSPRSSSRADDGWNGVEQRDELSRIVGVGGREADCQWNTGLVHDEVVLGAGLAAVGRVRPGRRAPFLARTLRLSALARDQSMAASSPSQFKSRSCSFCQTPTACQSRNRLQQVMPLPQPSSFGSSRQGHPVRKTKTMPARAARGGTRGRPPVGFGGSFGNRGSMASQRASGTRDEAFMVCYHATPSGFETRSKYDAEKANPVAVSSDIGLIYGPIAEEVGVVPPYLPSSAETLPAGLKAAYGGWVATFTGVPTIIVNTDVISTVPETWDDLLSEEFTGKIGIRDPRTAGEGAVAFLAWAYANGGDESNLRPGIEFAQKLLPQFAPKEGLPELEKGEIPVAIKYDFNALAWAAAAREKGINTRVVIPGVSVYGPSALMINKYNTAKADLAKLLLDFVLTDEAQTTFAEFGARPIRYVLGDLELPDTAKSKWLPDADYQNVKQVRDWSQVDANIIAETWDTEVLDG